MEKYIGTKIVKAEPMTLGEFEKTEHRIPEVGIDRLPDTPGYWVGYPEKDGESFTGNLKEGCRYISWCPADIFEGSYKSVEVENIKENKDFRSKLIEDILKRDFTYHPPQPDQIEIYENIRKYTRAYLRTILLLLPIEQVNFGSSEVSTFLQKINEAVFFANAAIARDGYHKDDK